MSKAEEMVYSEKFQDAIDRLCDEQKKCTTEIADAACEIWSKAMICYVVGMTKGIGGILKCYIVGVECFYKTLETVAEELCDKKEKEAKTKPDMTLETAEEVLADLKAKIAKVEFNKTLRAAAEELDDKKGAETIAKFYRSMQFKVEELADKKGIEAKAEFYKTLQSMAELLGVMKGKETLAEFYKALEAEAKAQRTQMAQ